MCVVRKFGESLDLEEKQRKNGGSCGGLRKALSLGSRLDGSREVVV